MASWSPAIPRLMPPNHSPIRQNLVKHIPPLTEDSTFFKSASQSEVLKELIRITHLRTDVSIEELKKDDFGLFIMVIGATDRAHHDWWKFIDPEHPAYDEKEAALYGNYILDVYQAADACIGKFLEIVDDDTTVSSCLIMAAWRIPNTTSIPITG